MATASLTAQALVLFDKFADRADLARVYVEASPHFTFEELLEHTETFIRFDVDCSGHLSVGELQLMYESRGETKTTRELDELVARVSKDFERSPRGDGITFRSFLSAIVQDKKREQMARALPLPSSFQEAGEFVLPPMRATRPHQAPVLSPLLASAGYAQMGKSRADFDRGMAEQFAAYHKQRAWAEEVDAAMSAPDEYPQVTLTEIKAHYDLKHAFGVGAPGQTDVWYTPAATFHKGDTVRIWGSNSKDDIDGLATVLAVGLNNKLTLRTTNTVDVLFGRGTKGSMQLLSVGDWKRKEEKRAAKEARRRQMIQEFRYLTRQLEADQRAYDTGFAQNPPNKALADRYLEIKNELDQDLPIHRLKRAEQRQQQLAEEIKETQRAHLLGLEKVDEKVVRQFRLWRKRRHRWGNLWFKEDGSQLSIDERVRMVEHEIATIEAATRDEKELKSPFGFYRGEVDPELKRQQGHLQQLHKQLLPQASVAFRLQHAREAMAKRAEDVRREHTLFVTSGKSKPKNPKPLVAFRTQRGQYFQLWNEWLTHELTDWKDKEAKAKLATGWALREQQRVVKAELATLTATQTSETNKNDPFYLDAEPNDKILVKQIKGLKKLDDGLAIAIAALTP